jgi:opacity protein-like surface antigen
MLLFYLLLQCCHIDKIPEMKQKTLLILLLLIPAVAISQFEQKVSVNLSAGMFSTFGESVYQPDYWSSPEDDQPRQMANYNPGVQAMFGIQYNVSRRFSVQADAGVMHSGSWFYDVGEGENYYEYRIWNPDDEEELLKSGENELTLLNIGIGLTPKFYLLPGKRFNPFLFAGISLNFTSTTFEDNEWQAYHDLDMLDPDDSGPDRANIENNTGAGFFPGIGLELALSDRIGFFIISGASFVLLKEENFYIPEQKENLNAFTAQAGLKVSFLKSKDL